ncbi:MFS transporter [Amycolatopsis sp. YIM 10]|uniref:MFS transporter n=1 Tax=Amycolatopsis sp. YIM 10 TaxID=2653857 RepID=UPI00128FCD0D|nr:MFS transporter [Amycolatopsis sp. YIM 10]
MGKAGVFDSLRVGEFRALWAAEAISVLGDQLARVALSVLVYERTASAVLTALTYALTFVPTVLGGVLLSGFADRFPRRAVMIVSDVLRALLAAAMAIPGVPLPVLWGLIAVLTASAAPFKAAQLALIPTMLSADLYQAGLAARQMSVQVVQVAGFGAGGVLVALLGPSGVLAVNAVTFTLSALLIVIGVRSRPAARSQDAGGQPGRTRGLDPRLIMPFVLGGLVGLFVVPEGLAAPYSETIGAGAAAVGLLMAADPVGSVIGAWWAARTRTEAPVRRERILWPVVLAAVPLLACAVVSNLAAVVLLWAISGVFSTLYLIRLQPMIVAVVPDARRGAVLGRFSTCVYAGQGVAILLGGVLAERTGPPGAVAAAGSLALVVAVGAVAWWRPERSRRARTGENAPATGHGDRRSDLLVTHSNGLLPERPSAGGAGGPEAARSRPGDLRQEQK